MNIKLIQIDGKLPNLALMKLSHFHKRNGDSTRLTTELFPTLLDGKFDRVYASAIFKFSSSRVDIVKREFPESIISGTGTDSKITVEDIIGSEYENYDYSIYPWFNQSIGFSQRGCRLKCSFCVVPKKEGENRSVNRINQIWRGEGHPKQIHLLDNDFFGQSEWIKRADEIIDGGFEVCLNQGINVRLIDQEGANILSKMKYRDDQFKTKRIYTAWDNKGDEKIFFNGIRFLMNAGINPKNIMVYMLCGYWPNETIEDVMYRFEKMKKIGLKPYPMIYDNNNKLLKKFQRWVIRRFHEFVTWEDYLRGEQEKIECGTLL